MRNSRSRLLLIPVAILGLFSSPAASAGDAAAPPAPIALPVNFSGVIVPGRYTGSKTFLVQAKATAVSTDAEMAELKKILKDKGQTEVVNTMYRWSDLDPKGSVRLGSSVSYPIAVVRSKALPNGGREVAFVSSRPISFAEAWPGSASMSYPIGIVVFTVDAKGKGEGKIYGAIQASIKDDDFDLSSWSGDLPLLVTNVRMTSGK